MLSVFGKCNKLPNKNLTSRFFSSYFLSRKMSFDENNIKFQNYASIPINLHQTCSSQFLSVKSELYSHLTAKRYFAKKKGSKRNVEDEESESDDEVYENVNEEDLGDSVITRNMPSMRVDTIIKFGLGMTKKKIEQDFYALKLRVNGEKVVKKSLNIHVGDEIDCVRGFSPDTSKYLLVDRIIIKGVAAKVTGSGMIPVKMETFKSLTIENYSDPWSPDSIAQLEN